MDRLLPSAPVVGVGAVVWKQDRFLLIRRGHPPNQGSWSLPGGHQELGETVQQAGEREILEETGVTIRVVDVLAVVDLMDGPGRELNYHYTVIDLQAEWLAGDAVAGDDAAAVVWADPDRLEPFKLSEDLLRVVAQSNRRRKGMDFGRILLSLEMADNHHA
ncbi:NUDIX domain-containing protein [Telmatospirillum sp.]|uniref:NUDIX domain-containing protein n=1 Tax=Telmatospirillum sp. TaxID=2079197 RepID=UPI00283F2AAA|nr:NUDIX domain-containing protein [Telmatospirillum sp.]MDR3435480.1 NUDIX domain-containing protein [Telmatospirillum sp.]